MSCCWELLHWEGGVANASFLFTEQNQSCHIKAFMPRTDRGGGGEAQAVKWRRRMAASSSRPHSVNLLSLSFPPRSQIILTYPHEIHTEHFIPLCSKWLSLGRLTAHVRSLCRTCPDHLWCPCQRSHLGLSVGAAFSQGWAVFRVTSLTTPIKPSQSGDSHSLCLSRCSPWFKGQAVAEAIKPRGRGEERARLFRMQGKSTRRTLCLRGAI